VRDWAVVGLGVLGDADSEEIRDALLRCVDDSDENVREEAAVGLGKRRDARLLPKLRMMLGEAELRVRVAEAAAALLGLAEDYIGALEAKFPGGGDHRSLTVAALIGARSEREGKVTGCQSYSLPA
jgi:HEAT repeat protein